MSPIRERRTFWGERFRENRGVNGAKELICNRAKKTDQGVASNSKCFSTNLWEPIQKSKDSRPVSVQKKQT